MASRDNYFKEEIEDIQKLVEGKSMLAVENATAATQALVSPASSKSA